MKCAKCGYPLPEDSRFCQYCGARIEAEAESEDLFPASPELPAEEEFVGTERAGAEAPVENVADQADAQRPAEKDAASGEQGDMPGNDEGCELQAPAEGQESAAAVAAPRDVSPAASEAFSAPGEAPAAPGDIPPSTQPGGEKPAKRQRYCKRCGELVHPKTKQCQGCGKQYFRVSRYVGVFVLAILCAALVGLNIFQYTQTLSAKERLERANDTISNNQQTISNQRETISAQRAKISALEDDVDIYKDLWMEDFDKAAFMDDYIVIIGEGNNLYHKYGCEDLDTTTFLAYNSENAKAQGYRACKKCNGTQE